MALRRLAVPGLTLGVEERREIGVADVRAAARRLDGVAHRTPVLRCAGLDRLAEREIHLKCENFQRVGAFKFRGAFNAVARLTDAEAARGVATHSSGNHGQALALAAKLRGIPATVVMPDNASAVKKRAALAFGAKIVECEPTLEALARAAAAVVAESGAVLVPPFDHPDVIAGQATCALELIEQAPPLDAVVAPVGGGGLVSGICVVARDVSPGLRVFGAEPSGADDAARSLASGERVPQLAPDTIADGLLTGLGDWTWPIIRDSVERIVTVDDRETIAAMRLVWERVKIVIEPSAAVAVAAVLSPEFRSLPGLARIGVVVSGGNVDLDRLPW